MSSEIKTTNILHPSSGSNNLVLASDGSATTTLSSTSVVPASIGGSMHLIQKQTASSSSLIEFTNLGNHSAFPHLFFIFSDVFPSLDGGNLIAKIATTGTTYISASYHSVGFYIERNINNGNAGSGTVNSVNNQILTFDYNGNDTTTDQGVSGQACLYNHNSSSVYKRIIFEGCADKANDIASMTFGHGTYKANKYAFTAIKFEMGAGNIASGSITMYGLKDA